MITTSIDTICRPIGTTDLTRDEQRTTMITVSGRDQQALYDFLLLDPESITGQFELVDFDDLTSIHLPRADAITVSGCFNLTEIHAASASYVGALDCPNLTEINAGRAGSVYAAACPQIDLKNITAPTASIRIESDRPRRAIAASNISDFAEQERITLEVNGRWYNLRQFLELDPYSLKIFSMTRAACSIENGADALTSLWLPVAREVVIHFGRSLVSVDAPVAESIEIAGLGGSLRIVHAPMATAVDVEDERLIWRGGELVPDDYGGWTEAPPSDEVTVMVVAPNRKR